MKRDVANRHVPEEVFVLPSDGTALPPKCAIRRAKVTKDLPKGERGSRFEGLRVLCRFVEERVWKFADAFIIPCELGRPKGW